MGTVGTSQDHGEVRIVRTTSTFDCGGRCPLRMHVKDNRIIRVEGDEGPEPEQLRTCLRCRAYRQMVHHPDRLMFPQKRAGEKGEGRFERISWDEALERNPFPTPSGRIEIFSQRAANLNNPLCPPIPKYLGTAEDRNDPLREKYPLQLLTPHPKNRVHSELYKVDWLREVEPHRVWINPVDAGPRGIRNEDEVQVFNDRGRVAIPAWLTERIIPGVVCIFEGAWYAPDDQGIDRGACANTLTQDDYSPGGASVLNTTLVQVEKA